jgi:hypothetical protein
MGVIDDAVSANETIASDYVSRAAPPKPKVVIVT